MKHRINATKCYMYMCLHFALNYLFLNLNPTVMCELCIIKLMEFSQVRNKNIFNWSSYGQNVVSDSFAHYTVSVVAGSDWCSSKTLHTLWEVPAAQCFPSLI